MKLLEVLNTDVEVLNLDDEDPTYYTADAIIKGRTVTFYAEKNRDKPDENEWSVELSEQPKKGAKDPRQIFTLTGNGGEFTVFSFAKKCMEGLVSKRNPETIYFFTEKGDKDHTRFYERLAKKFAGGLGYTFKLQKAEDGKTEFFLEKK